jgi:hypothetical protein
MYEDVDQYIIMRDAMLETFSSQKVSCHESCGVGIFFLIFLDHIQVVWMNYWSSLHHNHFFGKY